MHAHAHTQHTRTRTCPGPLPAPPAPSTFLPSSTLAPPSRPPRKDSLIRYGHPDSSGSWWAGELVGLGAPGRSCPTIDYPSSCPIPSPLCPPPSSPSLCLKYHVVPPETLPCLGPEPVCLDVSVNLIDLPVAPSRLVLSSLVVCLIPPYFYDSASPTADLSCPPSLVLTVTITVHCTVDLLDLYAVSSPGSQPAVCTSVCPWLAMSPHVHGRSSPLGPQSQARIPLPCSCST